MPLATPSHRGRACGWALAALTYAAWASAQIAQIPASDVPWQVADARTVLVLRLDVAAIRDNDLLASLEAAADGDAQLARSLMTPASTWLERFKAAGLRQVYLGMGAPVDDEGEEIDPPTWLAIRYGKKDPGQRQELVGLIGKAFGRATGTIEIAPGVTGIVVSSKLPRAPLTPQRVGMLEQAMSCARGDVLVGALVLPDGMRDDLARTLAGFADALPLRQPGPLRGILKRLSSAASHWRRATGGLWLGPRPTVKIEFVFDDPAGATEFSMAIDQLRGYLQEMVDASQPVQRPGLAAMRDLCRVSVAERTAIWEIEPERAKLLRAILEWTRSKLAQDGATHPSQDK